MTSLYQAIYDHLSADTTLSSLATGGLYDWAQVGRRGLTRATLTANDTVPIQPALFLHWSSATPFGGGEVGVAAQRVFFEVYFYQDSGYASIDAMRQRVMTLLHRQQLALNDGWCFLILWRGDVRQQQDEALGGVSMERSRYEVHIGR